MTVPWTLAPATTVRVAVASTGLVSALGDGVLTTSLEVRCRSRFATRHDIEVLVAPDPASIDEGGWVPAREEEAAPPSRVPQARGVYLAPTVEPELPHRERIMRLAAEALRRAHGGRWEKPLPLVLVLPPDEWAPEPREILGDVAARAGVDLAPRRSRVLRGQGATAVAALERAQQLLEEDPKLDGVFVVAAASPATDPDIEPPAEDPTLGEAGAALVLTHVDDAPDASVIVSGSTVERYVESGSEHAERVARFEALQDRGAERGDLMAAKYGVEPTAVTDAMLQWTTSGRALGLLRAWLRGRAASLPDPGWVWSDVEERRSYRRGWHRVSSDLGLRPSEESALTRHLGVVGCVGPLAAVACMGALAEVGLAPAPQAAVVAHDAGPPRAVAWLAIASETADPEARPSRERLVGLLAPLRDDLEALGDHGDLASVAADIDALDHEIYLVGSDRLWGQERLDRYLAFQSRLHEVQRSVEGEGRDALERLQRQLTRVDPVLQDLVRRERGAAPASTLPDRRGRRTAPLAFVPWSGAAWRQEALEEHLDIIARIGMTRRVTPPEGLWSPGLVGFDEELRHELDAVAGHDVEAAGLVDHVLASWAPAGAAEPASAFARALLLAMHDGPEGARRAVAALRASPSPTWTAQADALSLAPSSHLRPALERLAAEGPPDLVVLALEVLAARGEASLEGVALTSAHASPRVRRAAARALGMVPESRGAVVILRSWLQDEVDPGVQAAIAEALARQGDGGGLFHARERLRAGAEDGRRALALLVAHAGEPADLELLTGLTLGTIDADVLGWFGHVGGIEPLIDVLERMPAPPEPPAQEDPARVAARALHRITGALAAETPSPEERPDAASTDPMAWRKWFLEKRSRLDPNLRYRYGEPFTLGGLLDELAAPRIADTRAEAWRELVLLGGGMDFPSDGGWHDDQLRTLERLRARAVQRMVTPGSWPRAWRASLARPAHGEAQEGRA